MDKKTILGLVSATLVCVALLMSLTSCGGRSRGGGADEEDAQTAAAKKPTTPKLAAVDIFMENSGSMNGYVAIASEFKDVLGNFIAKSSNYLKDKAHLYYVNDTIYPTYFGADVDDFVSKLSPGTMKVGNTGSTDINTIFKLILRQTRPNSVSVLFSDCIYSVHGGDVSGSVSNAKNATMHAFMDATDAIPDMAVLILQCSSKFQGKYFNRADKPYPYTGVRPYYIFLMGSAPVLAEYVAQMQLDEAHLPGLKHQYYLSTRRLDASTLATAGEPVPLQILTGQDAGNTLRMKLDRHDPLRVESMTCDNMEKTVDFSVAFDAQRLAADEVYFRDASNWRVSPAGCRVTSVWRITNESPSFADVPEMKEPWAARISIPAGKEQMNMELALVNRMPAWVEKANAPDDIAGVPAAEQSFAIANMIKGIYDAFESKTKGADLLRADITVKKYQFK